MRGRSVDTPKTGVPICVTENGIATSDDARRMNIISYR
jgi:hypothetical protein